MLSVCLLLCFCVLSAVTPVPLYDQNGLQNDGNFTTPGKGEFFFTALGVPEACPEIPREFL